MVEFVFPPLERASVAVAGTGARFPVRRIFCVGRNYAAHAHEMGNDAREAPFFFCKPADALVESGAFVAYPVATRNLHYEGELVVAIGKGGSGISRNEALGHAWGYGAGIDLTRRDLQSAAKEAGKPWDMAKGFDNSAPCGALHPVSDVGHISDGPIRLRVNRELCQAADLADMIWSVPEIIEHLSALVALVAGDLIYTGTPAGVGSVVAGDVIAVEIQRLSDLTISIN